MPKVSIGMPVYNGAKYLASTLDALLAQTMPDFEIVVSDNASKDATPDILQEFARKDPRVKHFRSDRLIGPAENHARAFSFCTGRYFKFAAHDDLHAPTFLERCLEALERDSSIVLAYPEVEVIDSEGRHLEDYRYSLATDARSPAARFGALVRANHRVHGAYEIWGLMRAEAMASIPSQGNYPRADSVMLARLALRGRFYRVPEVLFLSRHHDSRSVSQKSSRTRLYRFIGAGPVPPMEWWDPSRKGKINYPEWRIAAEYLSSIWNAPISNIERAKCVGQMAQWLLFNGGGLKLLRDVVIASEQIVLGHPPAATA